MFSFTLSIVGCAVLAFVFCSIGAISRDLKLSNLLIKMLEEDIEYLNSIKANLSIEEREAALHRLDGKEIVYSRLRKELS